MWGKAQCLLLWYNLLSKLVIKRTFSETNWFNAIRITWQNLNHNTLWSTDMFIQRHFLLCCSVDQHQAQKTCVFCYWPAGLEFTTVWHSPISWYISHDILSLCTSKYRSVICFSPILLYVVTAMCFYNLCKNCNMLLIRLQCFVTGVRKQGADCLHMVQMTPLHPKTLASLASFKSRLVLSFWYRLSQVDPENRYDTWCYFNVCSKTDMSQLNVPHRSLIYHMEAVKRV